jgi:hypothetical protein
MRAFTSTHFEYYNIDMGLSPGNFHWHLVRDSSVVRRHYILLLEPSNVRAQYIRKTADLPHQLWVGTFPRFVAIGFY